MSEKKISWLNNVAISIIPWRAVTARKGVKLLIEIQVKKHFSRISTFLAAVFIYFFTCQPKIQLVQLNKTLQD